MQYDVNDINGISM